MDKNEDDARQRTIQKLRQGMVWYTHEELSQLVTTAGTHGTELISHWLRERRIFCVPGQIVLYPQFQFDAKHLPHPIIKDVLACFKAKEAWAIAAWFFFPNGLSHLLGQLETSSRDFH